MRKTYKKLIALCAVLIFVLALIPVTAFAQDPFTGLAIGGLTGTSSGGLFGAMAGMSGVDISYSNSDPVGDAMWNKLNPDSVYFNGTKHEATNIGEDVYDYITVDIGDWLDAQTDFISNFCSTYNVQDNDSGSVTTPFSWRGMTVPFESNHFTGPGPYSIAPGVQLERIYDAGSYMYRVLIDGSQKAYMYYNNGSLPYWLVIENNLGYKLVVNGNKSSVNSFVGPTIPQNTANWTSSQVNENVFDNWEGAKIKIPSSESGLSTGWTAEDFLEALNNIWESDHGEDIILEDTAQPPPPVPIPTTPLGDIPTDEWYDLFGLPVLEGQEEIHQDLQNFSSDVSEGIDDVIGELEDIENDVESIDTNLGVGNGLLGDLKSIGQSIVSKLDSILQGVQDLVQEIVLSTETFIAGLLNSIMGGLGGMFSTMREAFSIWHYVVEWVGSISTVFSWFWSVAGSTSYYIQLPIYASLAGAVVLAFYKRFGK